jgi:UDP-N-acetylglucosamine 2-epimerase (non-hydrolysing)
MTSRIVSDLGLSDICRSLPSSPDESQGTQLSSLITKLELLMKETWPMFVVVQGDTNTTLAASIVASRLGIAVGHVEAGLRSGDWRMPEEYNRRMVDHISTLLFAPTPTAAANLRKEHVWGTVFRTGNTVIDAVEYYLPLAMKSSAIIKEIPFSSFILGTFHRAENVDSREFLVEILKVLRSSPLPVVVPIHPRTLRKLEAYGLLRAAQGRKSVLLIPPLGYLDFLAVMKECALVLTDSGGVLEEATAPAIRKPVVVVRKSTERPEAVAGKFALLAGVKHDEILRSIQAKLEEGASYFPSPFGDGRASKRIAKAIEGFLSIDELTSPRSDQPTLKESKRA